MKNWRAMIKIFRYGNLLAQVDGEKELRKWIMANVPYDKRAGTMFKTSTLKEIAREKGYGFSDRDKEGVDPELAGRLGLVLSFVTLQDVVADLGGLDKRGLHLVGVCPHCHERMMVVYPQLYKSFKMAILSTISDVAGHQPLPESVILSDLYSEVALGVESFSSRVVL